MKSLILNNPTELKTISAPQHLLFIALVLLWFLFPRMIQYNDPTAGVIDQSIWLLVLASVISFLFIIGICWWLLKHFWMSLDLPSLQHLFSHFKSMELWQQLGFLWASFALLLLAALGSLMAIC
jgi:hypothetical protein